MNKITKYIPLVALSLLSLSSCNSFLDQQPDDSRIDLQTVEDARKLLVSAYPTTSAASVTEASSDNILEISENARQSTRYEDQVYRWEDITETSNDSPDFLWAYSWDAINTVNLALETLEQAPADARKDATRAEALILRAYHHFVLVNLFAQAYDPETAAKEPGIPYLKASQKVLLAQSPRQSVAAVYDQIIDDLEAALPKLEDQLYGPSEKYHFTVAAAHAFAARVYLYHRDWQKVIEHTSAILPADPTTVLRDYAALEALPSSLRDGYEQRSLRYMGVEAKDNLLLCSGISYLGTWSRGLRYSHNTYVSSHETLGKRSAWGENYVQGGGNLKLRPFLLIEPYSKVFFAKHPAQRNWVNRAQGSYYSTTTWAEFTTDEALLSRAEAYIHLKQYPQALADMNSWLKNWLKTPVTLTEQLITDWNAAVPYSTAERRTARKQLHGSNVVEAGQQENYLQVLLDMRRLETLQTGLRWFDIKRYGIEVIRGTLYNATTLDPSTNVLTPTDGRRAFQIPASAISAGMQPNRQ